VFQALRSTSGQQASGSERTWEFVGRWFSDVLVTYITACLLDGVEYHVLTNDPSEFLGRLRGL
jgi:hypothetical protein